MHAFSRSMETAQRNCTGPLAALMLAASVQAEEITVQSDVPFLGPGRRETMDVYLPAASVPRPVPAVIWIHGGGWTVGDKAEKREKNVCQTLAENGYAAFSVNYRLGRVVAQKPAADAPGEPKGVLEVGWPQNLYDCKSALRYIRKEASSFGIDPERVAVSGGSAGGHLALLVGMTGNSQEMNQGGLYTEQSNKVSCIIDFYGVAEIDGEKWMKYFAGPTPEETAANVKAASPATYLGADTPPVLIVHGDKDTIVSVDLSRNLAKKLKELGIPHRYVEVEGAVHSFDLEPKQKNLKPLVLEFLEKYLKH